jgi:hypothetical protein
MQQARFKKKVIEPVMFVKWSFTNILLTLEVSRYFPVLPEENHENLQPGYPIFWPICA